MSARRLRVVVLLVAMALAAFAVACDDPEGSDWGAPGPGMLPVEAAAVTAADAADSASPAFAAMIDPAAQAANDEKMRLDLAVDVEARVQRARTEFGQDVPLRVESGVFVLYAAEPGVDFNAAADFAQRALDVYFGSFFARRPDRAVSVELTHSTSTFVERCVHTDGSFLERAYSRKARIIVVNVGPGLPTISHELVQTMLSPATQGKVHLPKLFALDNDAVDQADQGLHYSEARAFCQWLDERGQLWPFYRAWRDSVASDPYGTKSFEQVTGMTLEQADMPWRDWARARHWP